MESTPHSERGQERGQEPGPWDDGGTTRDSDADGSPLAVADESAELDERYSSAASNSDGELRVVRVSCEVPRLGRGHGGAVDPVSPFVSH